MLADLYVLTPPFLVCAAFLTALVAFLRHEMRPGKNPDDDQSADAEAASGNEARTTEPAEDRGSGSAR